MDRRTFNQIKKIVYEKSGISLKEGKEALVTARIGKRMRALGITVHKDYMKYLLSNENGDEMFRLLDAISTNVTGFFREAKHFDFMKEIVGEWLKEGQRRFRFWSAACSSGEEPYSMAMVCAEVSQAYCTDVKILATDISTKVISKCIDAVYPEEKFKNVPKYLRCKYFGKEKDADGNTFFRAKEQVKKMIICRRLNLASPPFPMHGPLDMIFCRNVMIYFDNEVRIRLLWELYRLLKPGGYLMVGHAESLTGMVSDFRVVQPSIYTR